MMGDEKILRRIFEEKTFNQRKKGRATRIWTEEINAAVG
jgi:hypothetical protein